MLDPSGASSESRFAAWRVAPRPLQPSVRVHRQDRTEHELTHAAHRTQPHEADNDERASLDHFFESAAAACAPAKSPCWSSGFTFDALMMAGMASGQNRKIETIDIVMLLSTAGAVVSGLRHGAPWTRVA